MRSLLQLGMSQKLIDNRLWFAEYVNLPNNKIQLRLNNHLPQFENNILEYVYNDLKNMAIKPEWNENDSKQICSNLIISLNEIMRYTRFGGQRLLIAPSWFIKKHKILSYNFQTIESDLPDDLIIITMYGFQHSSGIIFGSSDGSHLDCLYRKKNYQDYYKVFKL